MDREKLVASLGGSDAVELMTPEQKADALEAALMQELNDHTLPLRGVNSEATKLPPMPEKPTIVDFYRLRIATEHNLRYPPARHLLQSAARAQDVGMPERTVLACLMHDLSVTNLIRPDHGYWCAQLIEPYVDERISWGIRYHQALRFFPDPAVGYEYPEMYVRMFGEDYEPAPYIQQAHEVARSHKWYMEARSITMNDDYAFDPDKEVDLDPFIEILERHFNSPKEGLGFDNSPVAHMWRTIAEPRRTL